MANASSGIYSMPPLVLSQDVSQSYWPWSGTVPNPTTNPPPTSPTTISDESVVTFTTHTNELDRYRVLFLIAGIVIGAMLLGKR